MLFGPPKDVEGQCNAHLYIGDDYGDGHATCRCQKPKGHKGLHEERFTKQLEGKVVITWEKNARDFEP